jgi:hypothetical protein
MGCGCRVASEKCRRNQGLAPLPAIFGPDNPQEPAVLADAPQEQSAAGEGEIGLPAGHSAIDRPGHPLQGALEAFPPRRMIASRDAPDHPAQQAPPHTARQPPEAKGVQRDFTIQLQDVERRGRQLPLLAGSRTVRANRGDPASAQPCPLEAQIDIRRIVDPGDAMLDQRRGEALASHGQQRSQQTEIGRFDKGSHAREAVRSAAARRPHGNRLGLVIGMVPDKKMKNAALPACLGQQPVTRRASRFLKATGTPGAAPVQDRTFYSVRTQRFCRLTGLVCRFRPQAVIDDQGEETASTTANPFVCQQRQTTRIATAGNGNRDVGMCLEGLERRHEARERRPVDGTARHKIHPQPFFCRSWSIRRFCKSVARG